MSAVLVSVLMDMVASSLVMNNKGGNPGYYDSGFFFPFLFSLSRLVGEEGPQVRAEVAHEDRALLRDGARLYTSPLLASLLLL